MNDLEELRQSFRPHRVTTLFVGESPPHGGTFFYKGNSLLYRKLREAFDAHEAFLCTFKDKGCYLDDLVLCPINKMSKKARHDRRMGGIPLLAGRMADYQPEAVVALMVAIEPMVCQAMCEAGLSRARLYVTPFPRPEHQRRFKAEMAEILRELRLV